jgi:O-antigen ligase
MTTVARDALKPVLMLGGLGYLVLLAGSLVWLHTPPAFVLLLTVAGVASVVLAINPLIGVHAFVLMWFIETMTEEKEGVSLMKVIGVVILGGWLLSIALHRRLNLRFNALLFVGLLFLAWCGVSTFYAIDTPMALSRMFTYTQMLIAAAMLLSVVDTVPKLRGVFWAFVVWTTISSVIALIGYYLGMTRVAVGQLGNRNLLAIYASMAIVCGTLLFHGTDRRGAKVFLGGALPVLFLGLALTLSRTGLIVLGMGLAVVWYRVVREKGFVLMIGSLATLCVILFILPDAFWRRAGSIVPAVQRQQETFGLRVKLWRIGIRMAEDRPVTGVGPGNFTFAFPRYVRGQMLWFPRVVHNSYISVAAEEGLPGLALFLTLNLLALLYARRAIHTASMLGYRPLIIVATIVEANLLVIIGTGMSGSQEHVKYQWAFFGLAMCVKRIAEDLSAEAKRARVVQEAD